MKRKVSCDSQDIDIAVTTPRQGESARQHSQTAEEQSLRVIDRVSEADEHTNFQYNSSFTSRPKKYRKARYVAIDRGAHPRSAYDGWELLTTAVSERRADSVLRHAIEPPSLEEPWLYFRLDSLSIYRPASSKYHSRELVSLDRLRQDNYPEFCFDGVLSVGNQKCFVTGVPFQVLTVDGYGDDASNTENQMCILSRFQSTVQGKEAWYQLGTPSAEYQRFYEPFVWLARFTKHFAVFLADKKHVKLDSFRRKFYKWLCRRYRANQSFLSWLGDAGLTDFRTTVAAHVQFLWKECISIYGANHPVCRQLVWAEVHPFRLNAFPEQPNMEHFTVVTPYAYDCFQLMYFGDHLVAREVSASPVLAVIRDRKHQLRLTPWKARCERGSGLLTPLEMPYNSASAGHIGEITQGNVICVRPEASSTWAGAADVWFAYVQAVRHVDRTLLDVLWLYEPKDTTLGQARYPFQNELFLSDNCSCGHDALDLECVISKVQVTWSPRDPISQTGFFVRQKFRTVHEQDKYDFVTLRKADFKCKCGMPMSIFDECCANYAVGDTVLVREWSDRLSEDRLQPAQILHFDDTTRRILVRRFIRKTETTSLNARPNELLLTSELCYIGCHRLIRKCSIRSFTGDQIAKGDILTPYDRGGVGDFFIVAKEEFEADTSSNPNFPKFDASAEGCDPVKDLNFRPTLIGMGIFCGGGTFDRGLEEGGAVRFRYAVDWAKTALHSYLANTTDKSWVSLFNGSVSDYLARALTGDAGIASPGQINVLAAGSPCPGFSNMQQFKMSEDSKRNASMVASVVSFVDFYVPEYLILENVVTMTQPLGPNKDQNVFSQIVAALVGLGYQVQQFLLDAWSHGSAQQRSRVFIVASASGLKPFVSPPHSHAHPPEAFRTRALGASSNGKSFGSRRDDFTTFQHISPAQAVGDLPYIGDSQPQLCIRFPDHRTAVTETTSVRERLAAVPMYPRGMGLIQAKDAGLLRGEPLEFCARLNDQRRRKGSSMYARVSPNFLFPTITTKLAIGDSFNGQFVHWDQQRTLTLMEARRAQGYPDHEVIVGTPGEQMRIVGNSVDRKVALVLGLALRDSWMKSRSPSWAENPQEDIELSPQEAQTKKSVFQTTDSLCHEPYHDTDEDETISDNDTLSIGVDRDDGGD